MADYIDRVAILMADRLGHPVKRAEARVLALIAEAPRTGRLDEFDVGLNGYGATATINTSEVRALG